MTEPNIAFNAYHSHTSNPPGVNLSPSPINERQYKNTLEKTAGQARALKLTLEQEKNKEVGWQIATQREKNDEAAIKYGRQKEKVLTEKHFLAADKLDTQTAFKAIEHARLRGKLSDTQKERLNVELGAKQDEVKYLGDARKLTTERHQLILRETRIDLDALKSEITDKREQFRLEGHRTGGMS